MIPKVSASMLEYRQPFDSPCPDGTGPLLDEPGLEVTLNNPGLLLLQSTSESTLQDALMTEIGLPLPAPQEVVVRGEYALLWLTPAEWLFSHPANETESLQIALSGRLAPSLAVVTSMSGAYACYEISGTRAAEVLMSGCSLNLHAHSFPANRVACTALADIPAIIWSLGEPRRLRCFVDRSFVAHLRDWLADLV